ncbi:fibrinogen-like YCDxxxxGGGW domain-containing protein [Nannocystaceae bacterium ST9]
MMGRKTTFLLAFSTLGCGPAITEAPGDEIGESAGSSESADADTSESASSDSSSESADVDTSEESTSEAESTTAESTTMSESESATTQTSEGPSDCFSDEDCELGNCLEGECVQVDSCRQLAELDTNDTLPDGVYELDDEGTGYAAYCDMTTAGGGWTLVLKSDGNADTFRYASAQWGSPDPFQPEFADLDRREAKLASYASVPFDALRIGMEAPFGVDPAPLALNWIELPVTADSLHALIGPGMQVATSIGRDTWKSLVAGASLQPNCNLEGFNLAPSRNLVHHRVRIGIVANEQDNCDSPNSRLGIGGDGNVCATSPNATGNFAGCGGDNGDVNLIGFGVVFVR